MSAWEKGSLAQALESVTKLRSVDHSMVSCAYTSQMDSRTGLLKGKRVGDKFYHENGDVSHADQNAATNILARYFDSDIKPFMSVTAIKGILLKRCPPDWPASGFS